VFALDPKTGLPLRENTKTYLNYGELPVTGIDLSMEWLPAAGWSAQVAAGYQKPGTFRKPVAGLAPPGFNAPTQKEKAAVAYRDWWRLGSQVELSAARVAGFYFLSSLPYLTGDVPEYVVADLNGSLPLVVRSGGRMRLGFSLKNLLDRRHIEVPGGAELGRIVSVSLTAEW
jgi:outer membrane receptor protein involved in Fe transport